MAYSEAAPTIATVYQIGGVLKYQLDANTIVINLEPAVITVHPDPQLHVFYFHQRQVPGDDPFTDNKIEPSTPFSLGMIITNSG